MPKPVVFYTTLKVHKLPELVTDTISTTTNAATTTTATH